VDPDAAAVGADAGVVADAEPEDLDAAPPDGTPATPEFWDISGMCGVLGEAELTGPSPSLFFGGLDFADDRYDDPEDRDRLTAGGVEMILDGNAGGSSVYSEVFSFELLARCEGATLIKTETEILYDLVDTKRTDILVGIGARKFGVSVTRAMTFPFGNPYTMAAATTLLERKLDEIHISTANVSAEDAWTKQIFAVLAFDHQHADVAAAAYAALDDETKGDTIVTIFVTTGDDLFIYTDD